MAAIDYDAWARTYDDTRGASPSVLQPLLDALSAANGRSLLDIGGGTGNFALPLAQAGFRVALCDFTPEMVRRAAAKPWPETSGAALAVADAQRLPFRDASFDCAVSINVLGHVPDWRAYFGEARRVIRDGPFVLKGSTAETLKGNWTVEYLPGIRDYAPAYHYQPEEFIEGALRTAGFSRVEITRIHYGDMVDGSAQALKHYPEAFLDDDCIKNTATFLRLPANQLRAGLEAIRRHYRSGRLRQVIARYEPLARRYGDGSVFISRL